MLIKEPRFLGILFASQKDWEVAHWLMRTNLSMSEIDEYLNLDSVSKTVSASLARNYSLQQVEMLPSGPHWKYEDVVTDCPMKRPLCLFYRNVIGCLQSLLSDPQLADCIDFNCWKVYESADRLSRVYNSFMMGNHSWYLQCQIPQSASLLGVILSLDKKKVTNISGNQYAHPVLISLANITSSSCAKASLHAYLFVTVETHASHGVIWQFSPRSIQHELAAPLCVLSTAIPI
ncbi:uncharacterized protein F5891DRAFT_948227 [Suillus fuscotomentosus]|uniref:Uncharacterized protein n=1 Tax=Suillus fuscotomentosus TaxID=1912939 RepID=A0AAD4HNC0_9AGAM|nr:uncharacterized protein F5891DRAFT_948227 [Suillus fuscotomentosus]KAG1902817.1 hypothetical protein F5891DRAFT_948227 [Suillus fuscotomentosus]